MNSPGKTGGSSPSSENKSSLSPRSNPVCLEVGVTIRSLPGEQGGLAQPIREEGRTVIVFDNGAVLRSASNLPAGLKVTLSNASGREVSCRVSNGHNLPSVKGYVEVEFLEPVNDFWGIHKDGAAAPTPAAAPPAASTVLRQTTQAPPPPAPPVTPRLSVPAEAPAKPASVSLGKGPSFDDIPDLITTSTTVRTPKSEPPKPSPEKMTKGVSDYSHSQIADPTSLANFDSEPAGIKAEIHAIPMTSEAATAPPRSQAPTRDFLSKGLMAYEKPSSSSAGRTPLLLGIAALVLAGVCGVVFVMQKRATSATSAKQATATQPSAPTPQAVTPAPAPAPAAAEAPLEAAAQAAGEAAAHAQTTAQPAAVEQSQPVAAVAPVPAVVTGPAVQESKPEARPESRNVKRQETKPAATKQPDPPAARRAAIPNLKMSSPSAPNPALANQGDAAAPVTEIASAEAAGAAPPAALLTSAGRTSNPPEPPSAFPSANTPPSAASAPAPPAAVKTMRDAKLITSVRPVYPEGAKNSSVQGSVTVSATIDANGKVVDAKALNGPMLLRQAAIDSVLQWKYSPALVDGKPASSQVTVGVEFRLR